MNIKTISLHALKGILRDKVSLVLLIVMPLFMIFLMGTAMKPFFEFDQTIRSFSVLYVNKDEGQLGQSFDRFINDAGSGFMNLVEGGPDAEQQVAAHQYAAAIIVPQGLSESFTEGDSTSIEVIGSGRHPVDAAITRSLVDSFVHSLNTPSGLERGYENYVEGEFPDELLASEKLIGGSGDYIETAARPQPEESVTSFQFFAASMLVFFLLSTGMGIGTTILTERADKTYMRIRSFPVTENQYLLGNVLGNAVTAIAQALIIILASRLIFGISWGTNIAALAVTVLLLVFFSSAVSVMFSGLLNTSKALTSASSVIFWFLTFLSGGFTPLPILEPIARFIPNKWALNTITGAMLGHGLDTMLIDLSLLLVVSLAIWTVGVVVYKRRAINE